MTKENLNLLKKSIKKIGAGARLRYLIIKNRIFQFFYGDRNIVDRVYLDLRGIQLGRYLYTYAHFLAGDFKVYLTVDSQMLSTLSDYSDWILNEPNIYLSSISRGRQCLVFKSKNSKKTIPINFDCFSPRIPESILFPYFMHPGFYRFKHLKKLESLRTQKKCLQVFFVGGFEREYYDSTNMEDTFGIPNRWSSIQDLKKQRKDLFLPDSLIELDNRMLNGLQGITVVDTSKFFIMQPDLQNYYGKANFHLALPGVVMPMCHNVIEAMVVGCIPILAYDNLFHPNLEHGKNCLVYRNLDELNLILDSLANLDEAKIKEMQQEVIKYYDRYLEIGAFRIRLKEFLHGSDDPKRQVYWNVEQSSVGLYEKYRCFKTTSLLNTQA